MRNEVTIDTQDGPCKASYFRPPGDAPVPAVLFYMDGIGIRPALFAMAERIAAHGYFVLLPDLFHRAGPYETPELKAFFGDPASRSAWMAKYIAVASQANVMHDTRAFLAFLDSRADVRGPKIGTTGYCMGGGLSLAAAGFFPDRVAAAASFHGSRLASDAPESPHLLAPKMKARVFVAGAIEDPSFDDAMKKRLEDALTAAKVEHAVETWRAKHGWVPSDTPVHDPALAERHFEALFTLFAATLT